MHNIKSRRKQPLEETNSPKAKRGRPKASLLLTRYPPGMECWCLLTMYYEFLFIIFLCPLSSSLFILVRDAEDDELSMQKNHLALVKELQKEKPRKEVALSLALRSYPS